MDDTFPLQSKHRIYFYHVFRTCRYIYPILDWEDHPGLAAGVVTGGCVLMPLLVAFWWCLVWLRHKIREKTT